MSFWLIFGGFNVWWLFWILGIEGWVFLCGRGGIFFELWDDKLGIGGLFFVIGGFKGMDILDVEYDMFLLIVFIVLWVFVGLFDGVILDVVLVVICRLDWIEFVVFFGGVNGVLWYFFMVGVEYVFFV